MLFLDCEFNGHKGQLLSMAIVGANGPHSEFYQVLPYKYEELNPWVRENVIPKLGINPVESVSKFRELLWEFMSFHPHEIIVADSPADFIYLLEQAHFMDEQNKYQYVNMNLKMEFIISGIYTSENPHNALADARALKQWYYDNLPVSRTLS